MFKRQLIEIEKDPVLQWYGIVLACTHILTLLLWCTPVLGDFQNIAAVYGHPTPICWTFFQSCEVSRALIFRMLPFILGIYGVIVCVTVFGFMRDIRFGFYGLLSLTALKWLLIVQDYRLQGNYHSMVALVSLVYLFIPQKRSNIKILIVTFYIAAGFLKFNSDWLMGTWLQDSVWLRGKVLEWALAYVIVLELVFVYFILFREKFFFWIGFIQLFFFHVYSWQIVGGFYPLMMLSLLSLFLLDRFFGVEDLRFSKFSFLVLFVFFMMQVPRLSSKDSDITGVGRTAAIVMFDATTVCQNILVYKKEAETFVSGVPDLLLGARFQCDPLVYASYVKHECMTKRGVFFNDLDVALFVKRYSDPEFQLVLDLKDACEHPPKISIGGSISQ